MCAVVKANAYGHGAEEVVNALQSVADCFAVALVDEGLAIRTAACGKDVIVFAPPMNEEEALAIVENGFIATVPDLWTAKLLSDVCRQIGKTARVHLKMNTGMNRYGMNSVALGKVCRFLQNEPRVHVEGIYTHLYGETRASAEKQRQLFLRQIAVCKRYFPTVNAHMGGTYAVMLGKEFSFDMTRVGLGLYGYLPSVKDVSEQTLSALRLEKGMAVYAAVTASRQYVFGGAGYGKDFSLQRVKRTRRLSVLRVGYADGFLRRKDNGMDGWEENANALCMDACIRENGKRRGQWTCVLSDAEQTAKQTETIAYEVLCAATRRAELIYENE